jgi:hypothetical protein
LLTASFKAHAALSFWRGEEVAGGSRPGAMGQFGKLRSLSDLPPDDELDRLIRDAAELSKSAPEPRKTKTKPKAEPVLHPNFAEALDKAPKAKSALEAFPPSARRDYLDWISEAKRDETRTKRIATAIDWLSEGKRRNWKYESC